MIIINKPLDTLKKVYPVSILKQNVFGTILDPNLETHDGYLPLRKPIKINDLTIHAIKIPASKYYTMDNDQLVITNTLFAANRILHTMDGDLEASIIRFQQEIEKEFLGKKGEIANQILAFRQLDSYRGVLLIEEHQDPEYIIVPKELEQIGLYEGDLCFIKREPVLWSKSIIFGKIKYGSQLGTIILAPQLFKCLGGDCDGDTISVHRVPSCLAKQTMLLWNKNKNVWKTDIDWRMEAFCDSDIDGTIKIDETFTTSLQAIRANKLSRPELLKRSLTDIQQYLVGLDKTQYRKALITKGKNEVMMKVMLGPAGSLATLIRMATPRYPEAYAETDRFTEKLVQSTLATKHGSHIPEITALSEVLNKIPFKIEKNSVIAFIKDLGLPVPYTAINYLYSTKKSLYGNLIEKSPLLSMTIKPERIYAEETHPLTKELGTNFTSPWALDQGLIPIEYLLGEKNA